MAELLFKGKGNVDIQPGGPGNAWQYMSGCTSMTGPSVSFGAIETRWCQDPNNAGKFIRSSRFRVSPDDITFDIMTKLDTALKLQELDCTFGLRARYLQCAGARNDPSLYDPLILGYSPADLINKDYEDLVVVDAADEDEILITAPTSAIYEYILQKMESPTRLGSAAELGTEAILSISLCSDKQCGGTCGPEKDGCDTLYALTGGGGALYPTSTIIIGTKDLITGVWTWTSVEVTGSSDGTADVLVCAGNRIIVTSNGSNQVGYSDDTGATWTWVNLDAAPSTNVNSIHARTAREIWITGEGGYVFKSIDGGLSYTNMMSGDKTTENLNAVWGFDEDFIVVAGDGGQIWKTNNGGTTWSDLTANLALANTVNILDVKVPPMRPQEIYVATNDGRIFRSLDQGATWQTALTFPGSGAGTVDQLAFAGPGNGEIMFIQHTNASNQTRLLRDNSGGNAGADVEIVLDYTDIIAAGVSLVEFTICNINDVYLGGANVSAFPTIINAA